MVEYWNDLDPWWQTAVVVVGAIFAYPLIRVAILGRLAKMAAATDNDLDDRLVDFARTFFGIVIFFVAVLVIMNIHEVEIAPWLAGAGIAGIAVALAAKETLADILAGIFLISDRPFRKGDRVKIESIGRHWGGWGDVVDVGLRRTMVRNTDGVVVNYPNGLLSNSVITNFSADPKPVRVRVRFQVGYDADLERTTEVAEKAISRTPKVLPDTAQIVVRSLWDDARGHLLAGVLVEGRYRIEDVRDRTRIRSVVLQHVLADLREAGIPMPAPRIRIDNG